MKVIATAIVLILFAPVAGAHGIEKGPVVQSAGSYTIEFSTAPLFPVTGRSTHFDVLIIDTSGTFLSGLNATIELHERGRTVFSEFLEEANGHYHAEYRFDEPGTYTAHLTMDAKEIEAEFEVSVDTFGLSGLLRSAFIIAVLLMLAGFLYNDCKRGIQSAEGENPQALILFHK